MGKTIFYIVFSRVQEERHSRAVLRMARVNSNYAMMELE